MSDEGGSEYQDYPEQGFRIEYRDASHRYWGLIGERREPWVSVTGALNILDKPNLIRWAGRVDSEAVLELERQGMLEGRTVDEAHRIMREHGMGAEAKRNAGATRGTAVHDALAAYCMTGKIPQLADLSDEARGYVQAVADWLIELAPEPILSEQIVGSPTHGFAGRFDLICAIEGQRCLVDLKTSAKPYPEMHIQLAGYQRAFQECGIEPVDKAYIVTVAEDGTWQMTEGRAKAEDFLAVLGANRALSGVRKAVKAAERAA